MNVTDLASAIGKCHDYQVALRIEGEGYLPGEVTDVVGVEPWPMVVETGLRVMTGRTLYIYLAEREDEQTQVQLYHNGAYYELGKAEIRTDADDGNLIILVSGGVISC